MHGLAKVGDSARSREATTACCIGLYDIHGIRQPNEVIRIMGYWLDMGVDGLRLDAIPYLIEREGTNNENLPETHEVLKKIRAALDERYDDRMLLAEANQWPEDTQPYFGGEDGGPGDECHMAFHFPLMPRMYMAIAQEDRFPITDILRQTPEIPDNCQWAIFLPDGTRHVAGHPHPKPDGEYPHKATHATITFSDDTVVQYSDIRQFGWWRIMETGSVEDALEVFGYGPEATGNLDVNGLADAMLRRGIAIKALLLDQSFIAGLGNIYVDEVLWLARVHPATPANAISTVKRREIIRHIPDVMTEGIRQGGAKIINNIAHPVDDFPAIHARVGEPCLRCGTTIQKIRVAQRGTYVCPKCQKLPQPVIIR